MTKALPFAFFLVATVFVPKNVAAEQFSCSASGSCASMGPTSYRASYYSVEAESKVPPGAFASGCTQLIVVNNGAVLVLPLVRWATSGSFANVQSKCADCLSAPGPNGSYVEISPLGVYLTQGGSRYLNCNSLNGVMGIEVTYGERDSDCR